MSTYLRSATDSRGDVVEHFWYCSHFCYSRSLETHPASDTLEHGGAYPCGSESDSPDYCEECCDPIGNPLTGEGADYTAQTIIEHGDDYIARGLRDAYPWLAQEIDDAERS